MKRLFVVLAVIFIGAWRGWGLWYRGLLEHDEGHALLNANTYRSVLAWVLEGGPLKGQASLGELRDALHKGGGTLYSAGKSGYGFLLALTGIPINVSQGQALFFAWVAGLTVLAAAGWLAYLWFGKSRVAAGVTILGLSFSPLLGFLSREVSGTIWALAFGMSGLSLLTFAEERVMPKARVFCRLAGGALIGYGFTCHFNLAPFVLAAFLSHACYVLRISDAERGRAGRVAKKIAQPVLASAIVLAAFQTATWVADRRLAHVYPEFLSFGGELYRLFFSDQVPRIQTGRLAEGVLGWGWEAWAYYGGILLQEGVLFVVMLIGALVHILRKPGITRSAFLSPVVLVAIPTFFWFVYPFKIERVLGMCVTPAWIIIGGFVQSKWEVGVRSKTEARKRDAMTGRLTGGMVVVLLLGLAHVGQVAGFGWVKLWRQRSPLGEVVRPALAYARSEGGLITAGSFNTGFAPIWKWTIIKAMRSDAGEAGRGSNDRRHVDFSRFDGASIVFVDPATWRNSSADFTVTPEQIQGAFLIKSVTADAPRWEVAAYNLRGP